MEHDNSNISANATDGAARRSWRILLLIGAIGAGLSLLLAIVFRDGSWPWADRPDDSFPSDALADYIPEDSAAVVAVNARSLAATPAGRRLTPALRQLVRQGEQQFRWMDLLGLNPFDDLDYLRIAFASAGSGQPLWLARGRLDRSRFSIGPDKLQEKKLDRFRLLEYTNRATKRTTLLASVGDALVVSDTPARMLAALKQARDPRPIVVSNAMLRQLLDKVDRQQSLWLAVSFQNLPPGTEIDNALLKNFLMLLFRHADSVHGGLTCAEDLRVELHFSSATEDSAVKLEEGIKELRDLSTGAIFFLSLPKDVLLLLRLLGSAETSRDGKSLAVRCRLASDQLGE